MSISFQEYFDKVCEDLTGRSFEDRALIVNNDTGSMTCVYLDPDTGGKCAIGMFIPDGHPAQNAVCDVGILSGDHPELEGIAWPKDPNPLKNREHAGVALAAKLQLVHDSELFWDRNGLARRGLSELREIADEYFLQAPEVIR